MATGRDLGGPSEHEPGQLGMVVRLHPKTGERHLDQLAWGLLPPNADAEDPTAPRHAFARCETVDALPAFADAFAHRRALVPVDRWLQRAALGPQLGKRFIISRRDGLPMACAGLWEARRGHDGAVLRTYCLVTILAAGAFAGIADRMPLMLDEPDWPLWLGEVEGDAKGLRRDELLGRQPVRPTPR